MGKSKRLERRRKSEIGEILKEVCQGDGAARWVWQNDVWGSSFLHTGCVRHYTSPVKINCRNIMDAKWGPQNSESTQTKAACAILNWPYCSLQYSLTTQMQPSHKVNLYTSFSLSLS